MATDRHSADCSCPGGVQVMLQVLTYAFLVVVSNVAIMVPVLLYAFKLQELGWKWQHAALFTSMVASTDAVAVSAILQSGACSPLRPAVIPW